MVKRFVVPFASTGDKTVTPDATDPGGAISYSQGWPVAYQLADTDPSYRPVGRQEMNGVLFDVTGAIAELQTIGFPEWVAVADLVVPYRINAYVRHNDIVWQSLIANNSDEPGVGSGATSWKNASAATAGRILKVTTFPASGTWTPDPLAKTYIVEMVAGGGAGSGAPGTSSGFISIGGGGGAGAGLRTKMLAVPVTPVGITIGAGGVPATGIAGGNGQATSFGSLFSVSGGAGGQPAGGASSFPFSALPGAGVATVTGNAADIDFIFRGGAGDYGLALSVTYFLSGKGGVSMFSAGGHAAASTAGNSGGIGAGGSGAARASATAAAAAGGAGGDGFVRVTELT
jgi:hypothetical protein